jgi:hypothetical protein
MTLAGRLFVVAGSLVLCLVGTPSVSAQAFDWNDLQPGHWHEIPNTHLMDVTPEPCVHTSCDKVGNVIKAWSGGAYDTKRDWFIVWGGGHEDYGGNEIYAFDVNTLAWSRLNDPSYDLGGTPDTGVYPDGTPRSVHSYGYIEYVANIDRFCTIGAATLYPSGNANTGKVHCNDFDNLDSALRGWEHRSTMPHDAKIGARAVYDSLTGHVWYNGYDSRDYLMQWDPIANVWSVRTPEQAASGNKMSAAIDPGRGVFVDIGVGVTAGYYNIRQSGELTKINLNSSGPSTVEDAKAPGFEFDPVSDQFVGWAGGTSVYALDFDARQWKECPAASTNSTSPGPQLANGTYGRFQYVPSKNAFIFVNGVNQNVFAYKLSTTCGGGPPDVTAPSVPQGVQASSNGSSSIDLTWQASSDPETGVPSYRIYRNGANVGQSNTPAYSDLGLADGTTYSYEVSAVNGIGLESSRSTSASATTAADTTPPALVSAHSRGTPTQVTVIFSEPLEQSSATTASNYSIDNGVSVSTASLAADLVTVTLTTTSLAENTNYTLTVNSVRDTATSPNTIAPGSTAGFTYVNIVTVEVRIDSGGNDVEEEGNGVMNPSSSDLELAENASDLQTIGLRFQPPIPQGATIVTAYVQFKVDETGSGAASLVVSGQAADNAAAFGSTSGDVTSRPQTSASASWTPAPWNTVAEAGPDQRTPNIASTVQEIVNRPGWVPGNSLVLFVSGTGTRTAESYNGDAGGAALLHVEYSPTAPATDPPSPPGSLQVE